MPIKRRVKTGGFLFALAVALPLAAQPTVEITGRYWITDMAGNLRVERNGLGTDIAAKNDLGMSDKNFPQANFVLRAKRSKLTFRYTSIDYSGDRDVTRTLNFDGKQYTLGTRVLSDLDFQHL